MPGRPIAANNTNTELYTTLPDAMHVAEDSIVTQLPRTHADNRLISEGSTTISRQIERPPAMGFFERFMPRLCCHTLVVDSQSVPEHLLTFDPRRPVDLPKGRYHDCEFDFSLLADPLFVQRENDLISLVSLVTNRSLGWPYRLASSTRRAMRECTEETWGVSVRDAWFTPQGLGVVLQSLARVIECPAHNQQQILTWTVNDTKYLKFMNQTGWASIPMSLFNDMEIKYRNSSLVSSHSISAYLKTAGFSEQHTANLQALMFGLLGGTKGTRDVVTFTAPMYLSSPKEIIHGLEPEVYHSTSGPSIIEHPAVVPTMCLSSDLAAVQDRLINVNPVDIEVPERYITYVSDLAEYILKTYNNSLPLEPTTEDEVIDAVQARIPKARMIAAARDHVHSTSPVVEAFVKKEAYGSPKDLRNISAMEPNRNLEGFLFTNPLKALLTKTDWYCPGSRPREIVARINFLLTRKSTRDGLFETVKSNGANVVIEGDFSRFDGSQCQQVRDLSHLFVRKCFSEASQDQLIAHQRCTNAARCYTSQRI